MTVFISFSSMDRKIAEKIYDRLKADGVDSWISTRNIPAGADYQTCIVDAIDLAKVVVLVFSSRANASPEIAKELSLASRKVLIPVRIEDVVPQGSFQYQLSNRQFVDLFDDFDVKLDELVERIKSVIDGGAGAGAAPARRARKSSRSMALGSAAVATCLAIGGAAFWSSKSPVGGAPVVSEVPAMPGRAPKPETATTPPLPSVVVALEATRITPMPQPATAGATAAPDAASATQGGISPKFKIVLTLLGKSSNSDRLTAIQLAEAQLPEQISAADAVELLTGTNNYRTAAIGLIARHLVTLGGKDAAMVLGDTSNSDRLASIEHLVRANRIRADLQPAEVTAILERTSNYRRAGIQALSMLVRTNLNGTEMGLMLSGMSNSDRLAGIENLVGKNRLQKNLSPDDAGRILEGTNNYRASAITVLAPYITDKLGGAALATVLGSTSNSDRLTGITSLVNAGRVSGKLQADDLELVLQSIGNYRTQTLKVISNSIAQ